MKSFYMCDFFFFLGRLEVSFCGLSRNKIFFWVYFSRLSSEILSVTRSYNT